MFHEDPAEHVFSLPIGFAEQLKTGTSGDLINTTRD